MDVDKLLAIVSDKKTVAQLKLLATKRQQAEQQVAEWKAEVAKLEKQMVKLCEPLIKSVSGRQPEVVELAMAGRKWPTTGAGAKIFNLLRETEEPLTKAEIMKQVGCSSATVSNAFRKYACFVRVGGGKNSKYTVKGKGPKKK